MRRVAVVLMNLGGPDSLDAVEPFLFNMFSDRAIISLPTLLRRPMARLVARGRARTAREIYARLGGASPLLANTEAQAQALEQALGPGYRSFYRDALLASDERGSGSSGSGLGTGRDRVSAALSAVLDDDDSLVVAAWHGAAAQQGLSRPTRIVCCYPDAKGFVETIARLIRRVLDTAYADGKPPRLLLTAHGLPKKIVRAGDPYPDQVGRTAAAVVAALALPELDWRVCYQSRVGPLEWIGPATDDEIRQAGEDGVPLVVAPISFVSEHSETLVELDLDYRRIAESCGVPGYQRVATVGVEPDFIDCLASLVHRARNGEHGRLSDAPSARVALRSRD